MRATSLLVLGIFVSVTAAADFGVSEGFSGRHEITCLQCHQQAPGTPRAQTELIGLPDAWEAGRSYALTIEVRGGPPTNPAPRTPDGGFDLEASAGTFAGDTALVRFPQPNEVTYTPQGTLQRTWQVTWTAPPAGAGDIVFWLASVAANGDHVIGADNTGGQRGDATATWVGTVPEVLQANGEKDAPSAWWLPVVALLACVRMRRSPVKLK